MGKFFESDMVREELIEINQLQQEIYSSTMSFPTMTREDKLTHIDKLTELLEKQKIMYARLSLSDDPEAKELLNTLKTSIALMGFQPNMDMIKFFDNVIGPKGLNLAARNQQTIDEVGKAKKQLTEAAKGSRILQIDM